MSDGPKGWIEQGVNLCFSVLIGAIALSCAVSLIKPILPTLVMVIGVIALLGLTVVVLRTIRQKW